MTKTYCIDGTHTLMVAYHGAKSYVKDEAGLIPGTIKIFTASLSKLMREQDPFAAYVIAWDSKNGSSWRRAHNPEYKNNRQYDPAMIQVMGLGADVCTKLGITQLKHHQAEADDLIYAYCQAYHDTENITIISSDHDMLQIVQQGYATGQYDNIKKTFLEVPEYNIVQYKALVGDPSDNIKGVTGIGKKKALTVLDEGIDTLPAKKRTQYEDALRLVDMSRHPLLSTLHQYVLDATRT